ncbi:PilN domain-containing protein [Magnetospirillum fulvum]|uniref:General secretion pathway protein L n=1 Tax=Magnetospirillum fulvum TaxID=1082 RepID=A0A1H6IMF4_MAGFU|nr:PilN domain-containing protein [Magnetospirillum fulvum]SEH48192.1 general secretion pathway protein L [Magnetospirillum fulvum]
MMERPRLTGRDLRPLLDIAIRGTDWWLEEMRGMLPRRWREAGAPHGRLIARREDEIYRFGRYEDGVWNPVEPVAAAPVVVCLPATAGLSRPVRLPPLPPSDLRRMIALDIDRLTPFEADQVLIDTRILSRDGGGQVVAVGVVRREDAETALDHARKSGLCPTGLALEDEDGVPRFDFLAAMPKPPVRWSPARLWGLAAALAAINLTVSTLSDVAALEEVRQTAEMRRPLALSAAKLRDTVTAESARRAALQQRRQRSDPLPLLDSLSATLPDTVWVQRLEWDGSTLRLDGWSRDLDDSALLALVEADPLLANARIEPSSRPPRPPRRPFDIVAIRDPEAAR